MSEIQYAIENKIQSTHCDTAILSTIDELQVKIVSKQSNLATLHTTLSCFINNCRTAGIFVHVTATITNGIPNNGTRQNLISSAK